MLFSLILGVIVFFADDKKPEPPKKDKRFEKVVLVYNPSYAGEMNMWVPFWTPPVAPGTIINFEEQESGCVYSCYYIDEKKRRCFAVWEFDGWHYDQQEDDEGNFFYRSNGKMLVKRMLVFRCDGNTTDIDNR